jgi:hypothetical protein
MTSADFAQWPYRSGAFLSRPDLRFGGEGGGGVSDTEPDGEGGLTGEGDFIGEPEGGRVMGTSGGGEDEGRRERWEEDEREGGSESESMTSGVLGALPGAWIEAVRRRSKRSLRGMLRGGGSLLDIGSQPVEGGGVGGEEEEISGKTGDVRPGRQIMADHSNSTSTEEGGDTEREVP